MNTEPSTEQRIGDAAKVANEMFNSKEPLTPGEKKADELIDAAGRVAKAVAPEYADEIQLAEEFRPIAVKLGHKLGNMHFGKAVAHFFQGLLHHGG